MENKRIVYLDILRILASLCVIYMHINQRGQFMFAYREIGSTLYFIEMFISMFTKMAVPVFFAVSGALLLHRELSLKSFGKEKLLKPALYWFCFRRRHMPSPPCKAIRSGG